MYSTRPSVMTNGRMSSLTYQIEETKLYVKDNFEKKNQDAGRKKKFQIWPIY